MAEKDGEEYLISIQDALDGNVCFVCKYPQKQRLIALRYTPYNHALTPRQRRSSDYRFLHPNNPGLHTRLL